MTTGTAFGSGPATGALGSQNPVSGFEGSGLVNSYLGGDDPVGTLTSPAFNISRRYLRFLVGGGNRPADEYVALLIGGKTVKTVTGGNSEQLGSVQWDLADYKGQSAVIQIVDNGAGGWGHILADDFVLTDQGPPLYDAGLIPAMAAMTTAATAAAADPSRPVYHFHAPAQWMNDPNGLIYYEGWYQLFYQCNPYASSWGSIHWSHARSRDLVNWQQLPIALVPSLSRGEQYVFSGSSALDSQGRLLTFYTSISTGLSPRDPEIWAAEPSDKSLFYWQKLDSEPVISEVASGTVHIDEWRDPFVVTDKGITYLITGGEVAGKGVVCLYQAGNSQLTYLGTLFQYPGGSVRNIECPNLFKVGSTVVAPLYISEIAPPKYRGRLAGMYQFNIVFGILIAFLSNALLVGIGAEAWRWMFGVAVVPSVLYTLFCSGIPESPRWLLGKTRDRSAGIAVLKLIQPTASQSEIETEADEILGFSAEQQGAARFWTRSMSRPIFLAFLIVFFNQFSGINAILYFAPRIFEAAHLGEKTALLQSVGIGVTNLMFTFVGLWLIDRLGRRTLLFIGSFGYIASLGLVSYAFFTSHFSIVPICIFAFIASHAVGQGAVIWVYISEIFPNGQRAEGQSLGSSTHWICAALIATVFPVAVTRFAPGYVFAFFCFMMVLQLIWVKTAVIETKGKTLEEVQARLGIGDKVLAS